MRLLLDTGVVGQICHPRKHIEARHWFAETVSNHEVLISEVADYELRRELIRIGATRTITRLDELARELRYVPVTDSNLALRSQSLGVDAANRQAHRRGRWP
jgi:predicted nucleic acid-binding protein